jgi:MerR family transcriptional regulator, Zn(II)-responsive regulator of zntA
MDEEEDVMNTIIAHSAAPIDSPASRPPELLGAMTVIELARKASVTPHVVRHYTRIGLLHPQRDKANGYKLFSRADLKRLLFIRRAKLLGYTLSDIRTILDEAQQGESPCPRVRNIIRKRIEKNRQLIDELEELQSRMKKALWLWEGLPDGIPDGDRVCHLIDSMSIDTEGIK